MRVHFLAFLGTSFYEPARYVIDGAVQGESRFVQVPLAQVAQRAANEGAAPFHASIFLTDQARRLNWEDAPSGRVPPRASEPQPYIGLQAELSRVGVDATPVAVPDGNSEAEHWAIFEAVVAQVREGDRLFIDVTHGFRSLPVLLMKALDYLQQVKGVRVEAVNYGVYEPGGQPQKVIDLSGFVVLGDWARAVSAFKRSGNLLALADEVEDVVREARRILRADTPQALRQLPSHLRTLGESLEHCHLHRVWEAAKKTLATLGEARGLALRAPGLAVLVPVLDVLEKELAPLAPPAANAAHAPLLGQLAAARYLIERERYLNGYAFLRETLVDVLLLSARSAGLPSPASRRPRDSEDALRPLLATAEAAEGDPFGPIGDYVRRQPWCDGELRAFATAMAHQRNTLLHCGTGNDHIPAPEALGRKALDHLAAFEKLLPVLLGA